MPDTPRLGILGAGQLGNLLCSAARSLDVRTILVGAGPDDPEENQADETIRATPISERILDDLMNRVDVITFEKEAIPAAALRHLLRAEQDGIVDVHPSPRVLLMLQNKGLQKQWLHNEGFPTASFEIFDSETSDAGSLVERFQLPLVQKALEGGYDGRGVQILSTMQEFSTLWPGTSLIERFVSPRRELAVLVARSVQGDLRSYAPVELHFDQVRNVLDLAEAPASIGGSIASEAIRLAEHVIDRLEGVGVFAVEMFLTEDGNLLINEISPRVHNAGHHTIESCVTSQFEQHVRAVCGLPLGPTDQVMPAAMMNLLCTPTLSTLCNEGIGTYQVSGSGVFVHWYGKRQSRTGRKLGHLTCLDSTTGKAAERASQEAERLHAFAHRMSA